MNLVFLSLHPPYHEVVTPNVYNFDLWKTSGHAAHYKENMFAFNVEKEEFGLKPMNCPGWGGAHLTLSRKHPVFNV